MEYKVLERLGMNENERKIYLFLLQAGISTAPDAADATGIDKATVYRALEHLMHLGFASAVVLEGVKRFSAAPPTKLVEQADALKTELAHILPKLQALTTLQRTNAEVELFRGPEGVKAVMQDVLTTEQPYYIMGHAENFYKEIPVYCDIWIGRIEQKKVKGKLLCPKSESFKIAKNEELRYLPSELTSLISTWVYGDKTAQFIMTHPVYVTVIKSKTVAESTKKLFDHIWKTAEKPQP